MPLPVLLFELLRDRTPRKLYYYSRLLDVSEATIGSDMEALAPWLKQNHLSINKRQGYGVILNGTEGNYREAMRRFIHENMDDRLYGLPQGEDALTKALLDASEGGIYSLLSSDTINRVYEVLQGLDEPKLKALEEKTAKGMSFFTVVREIIIGATSAATPTMRKELKMLLPTTLPTARSAVPRMADISETNSSGAEVPMATMVSPITIWGMFMR